MVIIGKSQIAGGALEEALTSNLHIQVLLIIGRKMMCLNFCPLAR